MVEKFKNINTKEKIRNVAVIAHVDHGKTTLIDAFLKQTDLFRANQEEMQESRLLDSNELEREKGITILSKIASVLYKGYKINIIDTPGHADFGGEVERTLNMADGCILVVDAQEGVMPQTEFVLRKAFENGLKTIVVINKIDKKLARVKKVEEEIADLFLNLAVDEKQLDFPVFYGIAVEGKVFTQLPEGDLSAPDETSGDVLGLLQSVIDIIPEPSGNIDKPFKMQISLLDYDSHMGRYLIGKVKSGQLEINDKFKILQQQSVRSNKQNSTNDLENFSDDSLENSEDDLDKRSTNNSKNTDSKTDSTSDSIRDVNSKHTKTLTRGSVSQIYTKVGLEYREINRAITGDIVAVTGVDTTAIGATLCDPDNEKVLKPIELSPPAVSVQILPNDSPLVGQEGEYVTSGQLEQRMEKEKQLNVGLEIEKCSGGYKVSGRGELQLSVLFETMRREGYEFQVKSPEIVLRKENGVIKEPLEKLYIDVPEEYMGLITSTVSERNGELISIDNENGKLRFIYHIRTKDLLGLRNYLISTTRGSAVLNSFITDYVEFAKSDTGRNSGVLISMDDGEATGYALNMIQERGKLFINPGEKIYEGMIIGINKYDKDLEVNPTKKRHKTSVRMNHDEITQTALKATVPLTLEYALVFINKDEMIEITPETLRLRKIYRKQKERKHIKQEELNVRMEN